MLTALLDAHLCSHPGELVRNDRSRRFARSRSFSGYTARDAGQTEILRRSNGEPCGLRGRETGTISSRLPCHTTHHELIESGHQSDHSRNKSQSEQVGVQLEPGEQLSTILLDP